MSPAETTSSRARGPGDGRAAFVAAVESARLVARKLAAIRGLPSPPPWPGAGLDYRVVVAALRGALDRVLHAAADLPASDLSGLHDLTPGGHFAVYARDALTICQGLVARLSTCSTPPRDVAEWLDRAAAGLREALAAAPPPPDGGHEEGRGAMGRAYSEYMQSRAEATFAEIREDLHDGRRVRVGTIRGHVSEANAYRESVGLDGRLGVSGKGAKGRVCWRTPP